jgi:hypothetical protein
MMIVANINNVSNSLNVRPEKSDYIKKLDERISMAIEKRNQVPIPITKEDFEDW